MRISHHSPDIRKGTNLKMEHAKVTKSGTDVKQKPIVIISNEKHRAFDHQVHTQPTHRDNCTGFVAPGKAKFVKKKVVKMTQNMNKENQTPFESKVVGEAGAF